MTITIKTRIQTAVGPGSWTAVKTAKLQKQCWSIKNIAIWQAVNLRL
jgi:hypothetical protein